MPAWSADLPLAPLVSADLPSRRPEREAVPALVGERLYGTRNVPRCQYVLRRIRSSNGDVRIRTPTRSWQEMGRYDAEAGPSAAAFARLHRVQAARWPEARSQRAAGGCWERPIHVEAATLGNRCTPERPRGQADVCW